MGALWMYQHYKANEIIKPTTADLSDQASSKDAVAATAKQDEVMHWPVADVDTIQVVTPYYSASASAEDKAAAMMQVGNTFTPSVGVSIARKDGQAFDVLAAKSGTVTRIETLPMIGTVVEVTHENMQKTVYSPLASVAVKLNDEVKQGGVLGTAGRNELEKQHGIHVHFEVFNNDSPSDPVALLSPTLTKVTTTSPTSTPAATSNASTSSGASTGSSSVTASPNPGTP
jgi:stage II sporulation protein Q